LASAAKADTLLVTTDIMIPEPIVNTPIPPRHHRPVPIIADCAAVIAREIWRRDPHDAIGVTSQAKVASRHSLKDRLQLPHDVGQSVPARTVGKVGSRPVPVQNGDARDRLALEGPLDESPAGRAIDLTEYAIAPHTDQARGRERDRDASRVHR
jgi:hypothetical protein